MCLAVPLRVVEMNGTNGVGEFDGVRRSVRLDFVPKVQLGDDVLVHAGFAIEVVDHEQAEEDRKMFRELMDGGQSDDLF